MFFINFDIVASKSVAIQVKTSSKSGRNWILDQKSEEYFADNLYYIFVTLNENKKAPDYFIVPSKIVATYISNSHKVWLKTLGIKGQVHNDSNIRQFKDTEENYLNRWDLLGL